MGGELEMKVKGTVSRCVLVAGLPRSGKKVWKIKKIPGQGKVREFQFFSGKFRKSGKSQGKVRELENFQFNSLLKGF